MIRIFQIVAVVLLPMIMTNAHSCLITEEWQDTPTEQTIAHSDSIFLARFVRLEPVSSRQVRVILSNVEMIRGEEFAAGAVTTDIVSAVHNSDRQLDRIHSNASFWEGKQANTRLMGDCYYAPVEYYENGLYLVLLKDGRFHTSSSFERILDRGNDKWLMFVSRTVAQTEKREKP